MSINYAEARELDQDTLAHRRVLSDDHPSPRRSVSTAAHHPTTRCLLIARLRRTSASYARDEPSLA